MVEKDMFLDGTPLERAQNACIPSLGAAHNPEVVGSSPTAATIKPSGFVSSPDGFPFSNDKQREKVAIQKAKNLITPATTPYRIFSDKG